jgi:hypothetical protein
MVVNQPAVPVLEPVAVLVPAVGVLVPVVVLAARTAAAATAASCS